MWARNGRWILPEMPNFHVAFRNLLHVTNLQHGTDGFTSPPKEGTLRIFSPWKIRRLRPGLNPRTWVPKSGLTIQCKMDISRMTLTGCERKWSYLQLRYDASICPKGTNNHKITSAYSRTKYTDSTKAFYYFNNVILFQYTQILALVHEKQFLQYTSPHGDNIFHWKVLRCINLHQFNSANFWWQVTTSANTITTTTIYLFCESRRSSFNTESIMYCTPAFWISDLPGEKKFTVTCLILIKFIANI